jgi:hypothetical protein
MFASSTGQILGAADHQELSQLWQQQNKRDGAHELLAPHLHWFTESLDTADRQKQKPCWKSCPELDRTCGTVWQLVSIMA